MEKNSALIASVVLIFLSVGILSWTFISPQQPSFKYRTEHENIVFLSNEESPSTLLKKLALEKTFVVSLAVEEGEENLSEVNDVIVLFQAVLTASDKNAISLIRETNSKGTLLKCLSNLGDVHESYEMSPKECLALLNEKEAVKVLVEEKNRQKPKSEVIVEEDKITILPASASFEASRVSVLILETMFADTQEILDFINTFIS